MISFYFLGDTGSGRKEQYKVSRAIQDDLIECDNIDETFVICLGDNIYNQGCKDVKDIQYYYKFEKPYRNIPDIPFYMCLGNHDYGYDNFKQRAQSQIDYSKYSNKWILPHQYYSFEKKKKDTKLLFCMIDTNFSELPTSECFSESEIKDQFNHIKHRLRVSNADWKIICGHHTWKSVGGHGNTPKLDRFLTNLYEECAFDLYLCGHDHNKQIIQLNPDQSPTLIVCGTGGKRYHDNIINYENLDRLSQLEFNSNELGFGKCTASKYKLNIELFNSDSDIEINYQITK